jgi:hypothetical protein
MRFRTTWGLTGLPAIVALACAPDAATPQPSPVGGSSSAAGARPAGGGGTGNGGQGSLGGGGSPAEAGTNAAGSPPGGAELGAVPLDEEELDAVSDGGTLTFQNLGKEGVYPSRRDPASGACDAYESGACCMTKRQVTSDDLTPWNEELVLTLRGPLQLKQLVVYTSEDEQQWDARSAWSSAEPAAAFGVTFHGNATPGAALTETIGSECLVDVMTDEPFPCGAGSVPYCPAEGGGPKSYGWGGSKLFVLLARMPQMGSPRLDATTACGTGTTNGWYNAPWIGLSLGELIREGKFGDCNCYGRTPKEWYAGDGCGQINAFEVVNDNNEFRNFDLLSSNIFSYAGNVGEGPCGERCDLTGVGPADLVDKATSLPARAGGVTTQGGGFAHVAFRRPTEGYRYVLALLDVRTRQMQLAVIHPRKIPSAARGLLPSLPRSLGRATIDALLGMRLPG